VEGASPRCEDQPNTATSGSRFRHEKGEKGDKIAFVQVSPEHGSMSGDLTKWPPFRGKRRFERTFGGEERANNGLTRVIYTLHESGLLAWRRLGERRGREQESCAQAMLASPLSGAVVPEGGQRCTKRDKSSQGKGLFRPCGAPSVGRL